MTYLTTEVKTEHLNATVIRKPHCLVRLEIKLSPEATKAANSKAEKNISKEVLIPGFRKGKAPAHLISQKFKGHIQKEWYDLLVNTAFQEFLKETQLFPFSQQESVKKAEVKQASLESGAELVIEYESFPEIPTFDFHDLRLHEVAEKPVSAEDVEKTIHNILLHHASWNEITDRPVQQGDFVDLDIDSCEEPHQSICKDLRFEVEHMAPWLSLLILGHHRGETLEGMSEKDPRWKDEDGQFKPTLCRVTIKMIKEAILPELNDEIAVKVGLQKIEELAPKVEEDLHAQAQLERKEALREQVKEFILTNYGFEIPASILKNQGPQLIQNRSKGIQSESAKEKIANEVYQELNIEYQLFFTYRKIAEIHNIHVTESDIRKELLRQIMLPEQNRTINPRLPEEKIRDQLYVDILSSKVLDFLISKASLVKNEH